MKVEISYIIMEWVKQNSFISRDENGIKVEVIDSDKLIKFIDAQHYNGVKNKRIQAKMTLREVEEKTGISNAYLSQLENEKIAVVYSDGKDYSHLIANTDDYPEHNECVYCGSTNQTITDDADICHECGEVYT